MRRPAVIAALLIAASPLAAQDKPPVERYRQSAAVLAKFPPLDLALDTPALQADASGFTSQGDLEAFLLGLAKPDAPLSLQILAATPQGRNIPILYFTKERQTDPRAIRNARRPVVWLIGQQHGNEPAGGEALLAVAKALAAGELRPLLEHIAVVIVPRANPDGAAAEMRDTALRFDMNRDHATLTLPEVRALHAAIQRTPPDVVVDAHEFAVAGGWLAQFGGLQGVDLMLQAAGHPMVPAATTELANGLFLPAIRAASAARGLVTSPYHALAHRSEAKAVVPGSIAPGIARNAFGLMGAVSILVESRGVGVGRDAFARRVGSHYVAIKAVLETAAQHRERLGSTMEAVRRDIASSRAPLAIAPSTAAPVTLALIEPTTATPLPAMVAEAPERERPTSPKRARPAGYFVSAELARLLRLIGADLCTVRTSSTADVEAFQVRERGLVDRRTVDPDLAASATTSALPRKTVPPGMVYAPLAGPASLRIAAALEADAPGSLLAMDAVPPTALPGAFAALIPVVRVMSAGSLDLSPLDGTPDAACPRTRRP